jgi:ATP-dependent Clp protease protease subunit
MIERAVRVLVLLCVGAVAVAVTRLVTQVSDHLTSPYGFFTDQVDAQVEAGDPMGPIDPDDPLLRRRTIVITAGINERTAAHVIPRLLYLSSVDPRAPIDLLVTTTGGWRDTAFAIIDAMRMIEAPVNTWAIGQCASSGALIVAGGTGTRAATANALLMVHANLEPSDEPFGEGSRTFDREVRFWKERARLPPAWALDSGEEYYLTAEEAQRFGVVDVVRATPERVAGQRQP